MPVKRDDRTGRWFFRAVVKYADSRRERVFGTPGTPGPYQDLANTKAGAIEAENRAKAQALYGRSATPSPMQEDFAENKTIREHAADFLATYKPGSKPSEKRSKEQILDGHLLPFFGDMRIATMKQSDVDRFAMQELKRCAVKTVNNRLAVLSSLIRYVTGEKPRLRFSLDGMVGELCAVSMDDVDQLVAAATDARYRVVVLLAAEAGLRAGEIRGLQWGDIRDGVITVRRALDNTTNEAIAPKHNKTRTIPMSPRLTEALRHLPRRGLWVVSRLDGGALGYFGMSEAVAALYVAAKVEQPPKLLHCLRHTFGTEMARRVPLAVLQRLMGHADIRTTLRYVDVDEEQKRDAIETVFGRGSEVAARPKSRS